MAWTFVVRRTAYGPERVQADAPHSAEAHRNALLRNALKKTISSSGDRERDLRGVQTRHQQCATKQVRVSMAGVASDPRWPRLVRGSDASVQGLRVISVQLCSHRCAPRRAAGGLQASASAPESLMGAQHCRTACRPTQAQLTGRIIRTTSIEPAAAKAGFATTIAIRRRPQADWPECTCPEGVPQLSGGARTVDPFCHGWGQWVVWGSSGPSVRDCTAHLQRQPCRCGLCCYARRLSPRRHVLPPRHGNTGQVVAELKVVTSNKLCEPNASNCPNAPRHKHKERKHPRRTTVAQNSAILPRERLSASTIS